MTNAKIRELLKKVEGGEMLGKAEQMLVLNALLRANQRIIAMRKSSEEKPDTSLPEWIISDDV